MENGNPKSLEFTESLLVFKVKKPSAIIKIGDSLAFEIYNRTFNWFQRKMMKFFFGFEVENV